MDADITTDGKLKKKILKEGSGSCPPNGKKVNVTYKGTFEDGKVFDQSKGPGHFTFTLGAGEVIKGWDLGVATMKVGEKAVFTLHYDYAYGEKGYPGAIPPKSTLIFEVELLKF